MAAPLRFAARVSGVATNPRGSLPSPSADRSGHGAFEVQPSEFGGDPLAWSMGGVAGTQRPAAAAQSRALRTAYWAAAPRAGAGEARGGEGVLSAVSLLEHGNTRKNTE